MVQEKKIVCIYIYICAYIYMFIDMYMHALCACVKVCIMDG